MATQEKRKRRWTGCLIVMLSFLVVLAIAGGVGWSLVSKEHREVRSLPLDKVDFDRLKDGTYHGVYAGGMYKWRTNECDVTVENGKVTDIQLTYSKVAVDEKDPLPDKVYDRVIDAQSLQVDAVGGATLDTRAILQAVENALIQAN